MRAPADISATQEVSEHLLDTQEVQDECRDGRIVALEGSRGTVLVGPKTLVKVNTNIGCSRLKDMAAEHLKIDELAGLRT